MTTTQLRREIKKVVDRLPADRLQSLADFVQFLNRPPLTARIKDAEKAIAAARTGCSAAVMAAAAPPPSSSL